MAAEKIFIGGNVLAVDRQIPRATAFAVSGDRFTAVGSDAEILKQRGEHTEVVDLQGKTVLPGLNDSHLHLLSVGTSMEIVDLTGAGSVEDMVRLGREFRAANPASKWLLGRGWSHEKFADKRLPSRCDLDLISTEIPVFFTRVCGHVSVSNSKALELACVTGMTAQPVGGCIDFDAAGEPTGILRERASTLVACLLPDNSKDDYKRMYLKGARQAVAYGLTSVQSDDMGDLGAAEAKLTALKELVDEGLWPLRMNLQLRLSKPEQIDRVLELKRRFAFPRHTVEFGPMKLMCDGSLGGRTAAMHEPYTDDPSTCGVVILNQTEIDHMFHTAHGKGMQVCGHAIGDMTMDMLLNGFARMQRQTPREDARPRIIHAQLTNGGILRRCRELGVVCDIQPVFVSTDLHFVEKRIGAERSKLTYAWKTMRDMGIATAGGSDAPVESCNPMLGLFAALTRTDLSGYPEGGWLPEQKLNIHEAIELFTMGSAYACFDEGNRGSITPGKLADFIVLPADITLIEPEAIKDLTVTATYVGGKAVFGSL